MTDPPSGDADAFALLNETVDFRAPDRAEWAALARGRARTEMQQQLVALAAAATAGTTADRLALLKAAYAVAPLHGADLRELCMGLVSERAPFPYADALVSWLAERAPDGTPSAAETMRGLENAWRGAKGDLDRRRMLVFLRQVESLGYRPVWLIDAIGPGPRSGDRNQDRSNAS